MVLKKPEAISLIFRGDQFTSVLRFGFFFGKAIFHGFCIGFPIENFQIDITKKHPKIVPQFRNCQWEILYKFFEKYISQKNPNPKVEVN